MADIMTTMRNLEEDKRMSLSIFKLVSIMNKIRYCKDIECLTRETNNLALLAKLNKDIWNWNSDEFEDFIVFGLRRTIFEIPKIIEENINFQFDFSDKNTSKMYKKIKDNIKKTFDILHMDIDVKVDMDTKKDVDIAFKVHMQLNNDIESLEKQRKMEEERIAKLNNELMKQMEEEKKIEDMQKAMQNFWNESKRDNELRKKMLEDQIKQSKEMIKNIDKNADEKLNQLEELEVIEDNVGILTDDEGFGGFDDDLEAEGYNDYEEDDEIEGDYF